MRVNAAHDAQRDGARVLGEGVGQVSMRVSRPVAAGEFSKVRTRPHSRNSPYRGAGVEP